MKISVEEFTERFKPIKNHLNDNACWDGCAFETYGEEYEYVKSQLGQGKTWTMLDCDGESILAAGAHLVNRMYYVICEVPYDREDYEVSDDDSACDNVNENCEALDSEEFKSMFGSPAAVEAKTKLEVASLTDVGRRKLAHFLADNLCGKSLKLLVSAYEYDIDKEGVLRTLGYHGKGDKMPHIQFTGEEVDTYEVEVVL